MNEKPKNTNTIYKIIEAVAPYSVFIVIFGCGGIFAGFYQLGFKPEDVISLIPVLMGLLSVMIGIMIAVAIASSWR